MKKILKLNNVPIWNLIELQREFSPLAAYETLQAFCLFANAHCVPLPLRLKREENGHLQYYQAKYLKKEFWMNILTRQEWPKADSAVGSMNCFIQECYDAETGGPAQEGTTAVQGEEIKEKLQREIDDASITEKMYHICQSGELGNSPEDIRKAVILLAICEIAEVNAMTQVFRSVQHERSVGEPAVPKEFFYDKNAPLIAAEEAYRFWYHDDDILKDGSRIQTVCIKAQPSTNQYAVVKIELYSPKTGKCVQRITLKKGEYRYCNVSEGKIIQFLPNASISNDLCLVRRDASKADYEVISQGGESWNLKQGNISCIAAGSQDTGFLVLSEGKVMTAFYKPAKDYMVQLQFDMIMMNVVEIGLSQQGYTLLLEDGTVISNGKSKKEQRVCLRSNRLPVLEAADKSVSEIVLSESGRTLVALCEKKPPRICFDSRDFHIKTEDGVILVEI